MFDIRVNTEAIKIEFKVLQKGQADYTHLPLADQD